MKKQFLTFALSIAILLGGAIPAYALDISIMEKDSTKSRNCPYRFLLESWQSDGGQSEHPCCSCKLGNRMV